MAAQAVAYTTTRRASQHADKKLNVLKQVLKNREAAAESGQTKTAAASKKRQK